MKKILVSAGDPSGDQLLSRIIKCIHQKAPGQYHFWGLAGPLCQHEGVEVIVNSKDVAVVGLWEVLGSASKIFKALRLLSKSVKESESIICVDFPDFNFRLALVAEKLQKPIDYIVAPQVWAWRSGRMIVMKRWIRRLYPALPFEETLFRNNGIDAKFMGHPIRDLLPPKNRRGARDIFKFSDDENILAIFAGSRKSEISRNLPFMIDAWEDFKRSQEKFGVKKLWSGLFTLAHGWKLDDIKSLLSKKYRAKLETLLQNEWRLSYQNHASLMASDFGWITSGTASLEAAYYQLPHVLVYKLSFFTATVFKSISDYASNPDAMVGLPNILLDKKIIPELLQSNLTARRLATETLDLLQDPHRIDYMRKYLRWIPKKLGDPGVSERIADDLLRTWQSKGLSERE